MLLLLLLSLLFLLLLLLVTKFNSCLSEIIDKVLDLSCEPPFRPTLRGDHCPEKLGRIIRCCWEDNPLKRPTIREIKASLKEIGGSA